MRQSGLTILHYGLLDLKEHFSPVLSCLQIQKVERTSWNVHPKQLVPLCLVEWTLSNPSLGIVEQFHSWNKHYEGQRAGVKAGRRWVRKERRGWREVMRKRINLHVWQDLCLSSEDYMHVLPKRTKTKTRMSGKLRTLAQYKCIALWQSWIKHNFSYMQIILVRFQL